MPSYQFPDCTAVKLIALDDFIRKRVSWESDFEGLNQDPITVSVSRALTDTELADLNTLVASYTDPAQFLVFDHSESLAMHSHYTEDVDNIRIDNKYILQTFVFVNRNSEGLVLDSCKTIVEYTCDNVQNFVDTTSGNVNVEIYDITRNVSISNKTIDISPIATQWNTLAQTGSTSGSTIFASTTFDGLMNKTTGYDVIFQLRGSITNPPNFDFRLNGLQYLFYTVQ